MYGDWHTVERVVLMLRGVLCDIRCPSFWLLILVEYQISKKKLGWTVWITGRRGEIQDRPSEPSDYRSITYHLANPVHSGFSSIFFCICNAQLHTHTHTHTVHVEIYWIASVLSAYRLRFWHAFSFQMSFWLDLSSSRQVLMRANDSSRDMTIKISSISTGLERNATLFRYPAVILSYCKQRMNLS